jgi:hypothetical protein
MYSELKNTGELEVVAYLRFLPYWRDGGKPRNPSVAILGSATETRAQDLPYKMIRGTAQRRRCILDLLNLI